MSDPKLIKEIINTVTIPVMAKCRIGHFVEAQVCRLFAPHGFFFSLLPSFFFWKNEIDVEILEAIGIDYIDESEVLTPADEIHHINKHNYKVPFVCGCRNLGEALRRISVYTFPFPPFPSRQEISLSSLFYSLC